MFVIGDDPFIDNLPATTLVQEHLPPGFAIYHVIASNNRNYNDIVHVNFTYSLQSSTSLFQIDSATGKFKVQCPEYSLLVGDIKR